MARVAGHPPLLRRTTRGASLAAQALLLAAVCVYLGRLASAEAFGMELVALLLLAAIVLAVAIPPHIFVALGLVVFGTFSISDANPLQLGGVQVFSTDVLLGVVLLRAVLPRERVRPPAALDGPARLLFALWAVVMIVAGLRAVFSGYELPSIIRLGIPLIYSVGFYLGFGRIVRERGFEFDKAVRNLLIVALGFVAYMAFARLTNAPFETDQTEGRLGTVVTTGGELRRDYGLASAFILYPALALAGAAYLLWSPRRTAVAAAAATIGIVATLLTLIRAEIFGLVAGLAVMALLRSENALRRAVRTRAVLAASFAFLVVGLVFWVVSPSTARGVAERSLPGLVEQSRTAEATAEVRQNALAAGFEAARRNPVGVGLVPDEGVTERSGVGLEYLAHSTGTRILVYSGWIGFVAAVLALLGVLRASFTMPRPVPWLHPLFVGWVLLLVVYGFGASGVMGQGWVIGLAALIAALRFNATGTST